MADEKTIGIDAHLFTPPKGAYEYVKDILKSKGDNPTKAANKLGVSPSTVKRLLDGGSLTPLMAAKLNTIYAMDISTLFNMEAQAYTYQAEKLAKIS